MKSLAVYGYVREPSETLRHFAIRVDNELKTADFTELTKIYEAQVYSNNDAEKGMNSNEIELTERIIALLNKHDK